MKILYKKFEGLQIPKQAHEGEDAAYDIFAASGPRIVGDFINRFDGTKLFRNITFIEYATNLFIAPQDDVTYDYVSLADGDSHTGTSVFRASFHTHLYPRSSISKYNLVLANSVATIDTGYRDQIFVRFKYLPQPEDLAMIPEAGINRIYSVINDEKIYQQGDRIVQLIATPNISITFEETEKLPEAQRNLGKFGSSGN